MAVSLKTLPGVGACAVAIALAGGVSSAAAATHHASSSGTPPTVSGKVIEVGGGWFTIQTNGRQVGVINALARTATRITNADTPYVWGGGHAEAGVASLGMKGPGYTGRTKGYDCSGSVAAVLAGAGLWPAGAGVPSDSGVISELLAEHIIARGISTSANAVNLYDDPGVHIFMNIDGRYFGTSDGDGGANSAGGAGWLADSASDASNPAFKHYHVLPSVLGQRTSYGSDYTFQLPASGLFTATNRNNSISLGQLPASDLISGERVRVSYLTQSSGAMAVQTVAVLSGGPNLSAPTTTTTTPTTTTPVPGAPTVTTPTGTPVGTVTIPVASGSGGTGTAPGAGAGPTMGQNGGSGFGSGAGSGWSGAGSDGGAGWGQ